MTRSPVSDPVAQHSTSAVYAAEDVVVRFGGVTAVDGMSIDVRPGEVVGLLGPNGAGKTTLFEVLSGFVRPDAGTVRHRGVDITGLAPHERARLGIRRGFQDARLYPNLTVRDVLRVGLDTHVQGRVDLAGMLLGLGSARRVERFLDHEVDRLVERFGLARYASSYITELSTGTRRVVELASVFGAAPSVILLDEPTAGVAQSETGALLELFAGVVAETEVSVLLIEHDVPMVMTLSDRVFVMAIGAPLAEGTPEEIQTDEAVMAAYFGAV